MVSMNNFAHVCSNIVNASRVRLGMTNIVMTKYHLYFALALQKEGLVSTVALAGKKAPPPPQQPSPESRQELVEQLAIAPWTAYPDPRDRTLPDRDAQVVPLNPAQQRIWIGLKYYRNEPVISKIQMISKPSKRVTLKLPMLRQIVSGRRANFVEGLSRPGECLFVFTCLGLLESREAVQRQVGGLALCRVWT